MKLFKALFFALALVSLPGFAAPVNVNTADAKTLMENLNGVGPAIAEAIVAYRNEHGPFKSVDELLNVKGIGPKILERNRELILLKESETQKAK